MGRGQPRGAAGRRPRAQHTASILLKNPGLLLARAAGPRPSSARQTLDDLRPHGRSFSQLHYLIGLGLVADDLS